MAFLFETLLLDVGALAACLLLAVYIYFQRAFKYWEKKKAPFIKPSFPFGTFKDSVILRKPVGEMFASLYKKLEGERFGGTFMFANPGVIFRDPELIKNVLVKDFAHFHDRGFCINEEREPLTGHLFFLPGTRWRNLRVKLSPTFTSGKMKMMFQTLVDCGLELGNLVDNMTSDGQIIEIKDVLARYSTDIISSCAFGIQCNSLKDPNAEFRQWGRKIFEPSIKSTINGLLRATIPKLMKYIDVKQIDETVSKYFLEMVKDTVNYREKNDIKRNDFMQLLIQLKKNGFIAPDHQTNGHTKNEITDTSKLSIESLAAQAFVFFAAGFETSSTTMTFCLYELSLQHDIQEKVREEIRTVLKKYEGKITYDCIQEMTYLDQVVSETLRKYPPVPILNRDVSKEYTIPGTDVVLEQGTPTVIPVLAIQHDPKHYPNPEKFDPDRFTEEETQKRHPYVYLPFGEGPRICIGMRFGLMQTKIGLVSLLSKFKFDASNKTQIPLKIDKKSFIMAPVGGMWLKITKC